MLGKLIKYEFKATARLYLLLYAALLVVTLIYVFMVPFIGDMVIGSANLPEFVETLYATVVASLTALYSLIAVAVIFVTVIVTVVRFYSLLGDSGHLWFTLPVPVTSQVFGRLIPAMVWTLASGIVSILSLLLLALSSFGLQEVVKVITGLWNSYIEHGYNPLLYISLGLVTGCASWLSTVLTYYAAMSIGPNLIKSRLGGSVLAYLGLNFASSFVTAPITMTLMAFFAYRVHDEQQLMLVYCFTVILTSLAVAGACYTIIHRFVSKKLNLA